MKKTLITLGLFGFLLASSGVLALTIYTDQSTPKVLSLQTPRSSKCGQATCKSYWFGIVTLGDCSYQAAMRNAGITQVHHHDEKVKGWFWKRVRTTRVYGE